MKTMGFLKKLFCIYLLFTLFSCEQAIENLTEPKDRYYITNQTTKAIGFVLYKEGKIVKEDTIERYKEAYIGEDGYFFTDSVAIYDPFNSLHVMVYRNLQYEASIDDLDLQGHFYYSGSWYSQDDTHYTFIFPGFYGEVLLSQ